MDTASDRLRNVTEQLPTHGLVFQPIVMPPFRSGAPVAYWEALSRYTPPQGPRKAPLHWLQDPARAMALDLAVLSQAAEWTTAPCPLGSEYAPRIGVNVNAHSLLDPLYLEQLYQHLDHGLDPTRLVVELTETYPMETAVIDPLVERLTALRGAGIDLALDDFGTGGAGLGMFSRFDFDYVKVSPWIDLGSERGSALFEALLQAAAVSKGFEVILEGVETHTQLERANEVGVHAIQGYLLGRPAPELRAPIAPSASLVGSDKGQPPRPSTTGMPPDEYIEHKRRRHTARLERMAHHAPHALDELLHRWAVRANGGAAHRGNQQGGRS